MDLSKKIARLKAENKMTTDMLAALSGVPRGTINKILVGETRNPTARTVAQLARALGCEPETLYPPDIRPEGPRTVEELLEKYPNLKPVKLRKIPLLGTIAAGRPMLANESVECYFAGDEHCDFALRVKGDSMIRARINDGDIVFIKKQSAIDDGAIAAVIIDDEATLKRVYRVRGGITLVAENPNYPPLVFTGEDCDSVRILGVAVGFWSKL